VRLYLHVDRDITYRGSRAQRLLSTLEDGDTTGVLADVLAAELRQWDGTLQDRSGSRSNRGFLVWDLWTGTLSAALRVTPGLAGTVIDDGTGARTLEDMKGLCWSTSRTTPVRFSQAVCRCRCRLPSICRSGESRSPDGGR
jgi:hypothetical protein